MNKLFIRYCNVINICLALILLICRTSIAQVTLPDLFSDGMILQRDKPIKIWGWASPKEKITVQFKNKNYHIIAAPDSSWQMLLPSQPLGIPQSMTISGKNVITLRNILFGDVWLCSGQSNMAYTIEQCGIYEQEIDNTANENVRIIDIKQSTGTTESNKIKAGKWKTANKETLASLTATGYFFAKYLNQKQQVPIGIINSSWGGSSIEFWMSATAMKPFQTVISKYKIQDTLLQGQDVTTYRKEHLEKWVQEALLNDLGEYEKWYADTLKTKYWKAMHLPTYWEKKGLYDRDGIVWFEKKINIPSTWVGKNITIHFDAIDDLDHLWLNGKLMGQTDGYDKARNYEIAATNWKQTDNVISVRVLDYGGNGGISGADMYLQCGADKIDLTGSWKYKASYDLSEQKDYIAADYAWSQQWKPSSIFNAMIAPLKNYAIKGAVWYQGESNAESRADAKTYSTLLSALITDWRKNWNIGDFPFLIAQLPNFGIPDLQPSESNWAIVRQAQWQATLLPSVATSVNIDLGESNDIHPKNKSDIGYRLALAASTIAYPHALDYNGISPYYESFAIEGNRIKIKFRNYGKGLVAKDKNGYVKGFEIAGDDGIYYWAKARISNSFSIIVYSDEIEKPIKVRYAWSDNPIDANVYNSEGLPASPFETSEVE